MLVSANESAAAHPKGGAEATFVETSQAPNMVAINCAVVAMFSLIVFSSIAFTDPIWTLRLTQVHLVMLFPIAFLLLVGYYLKISAIRYSKLEQVRKNVLVSVQTVTKSMEAIDTALKSVNSQTTSIEALLTANMLSTNKAQLGTFNEKLQETTEQFKKLLDATKSLKESRQALEQRRQRLLALRTKLS